MRTAATRRNIKCIVQFSGGIASYVAARRMVDKYGKDQVLCLFADTLIEDEDLYRFLGDAMGDLQCHYVRIADGRNPYEIFIDQRYLGNSRKDPCSKYLKRRLIDRYMKQFFNPDHVEIAFGIDITEAHRAASGEPEIKENETNG